MEITNNYLQSTSKEYHLTIKLLNIEVDYIISVIKTLRYSTNETINYLFKYRCLTKGLKRSHKNKIVKYLHELAKNELI